MKQEDTLIAPTRAQDTVVAFLKALNAENFEKARTYAQDNLQFVGVMGKRDGAEAYFNDMQRMKFKYDIQKVFQEGEEVAVFYDIEMDGKTIFSAGWYVVENEKIRSIRVVFDPRPLL